MNKAIQNLIRDLNWIKNDVCYKAPEEQRNFICGRWFPMIIASVEKVEKEYLATEDNR